MTTRFLLPALLAPVALASSAGAQTNLPEIQCEVPCSAGNPTGGLAYCNSAAPPYKQVAYDFIPMDGQGNGFHVVYSHRGDGPAGTPGSENNVCIYLFELNATAGGKNQVLIFGAGYGDWEGVATYGARCDARFVDYVIRNELGFSPSNTVLQFVAPHGHYDHINPDLPRRLVNLDYSIGRIRYHPLDWDLMQNQGGSACRTQLCPISYMPYANSGLPEIWEMNWGGNGGPIYNLCEANLVTKLLALEESKTFGSPLGTIRVSHVPGHTCGSVDLIIDADPVFVRVLGSNVVCTPPSWVTSPLLYGNRLTAHGNIVVPDVFGYANCP